MTSPEPVLDVAGLTVRFGGRGGVARVVTDVSWQLRPGETLAIVGESGSGKSVSTLALTGLLPTPPATITGSVTFRRADGPVQLVGASGDVLRSVRGAGIGMVFQDPMTSLNPVLTIGRQLTESLQQHRGMSRRQARDRAAELLAMVGISDPVRRLDDHPHRFSGGMRQRVMIAIGLSCEPAVLIADEATTALDVTTQASIVELVADLQQRLGMAVIWISHDLGVVARIADRVLVMYAGRVVEEAPVDDLYAHPHHPYTAGLLQALPVLGRPEQDLATIPGLPPDPTALPPGCPFFPRCSHRLDSRCRDEVPPLREVAAGHLVRTFYDVPRVDVRTKVAS